MTKQTEKTTKIQQEFAEKKTTKKLKIGQHEPTKKQVDRKFTIIESRTCATGTPVAIFMYENKYA